MSKILNDMLEAGREYDKQLLEHSTDRDETFTPDGIPDSWLDDNGVRHAVIWEQGIDAYMRLTKVGNKWVLSDISPF